MSITNLFQRYGLYFAWVISLVATGGSLYFSEVLKWVPCTLCWYQRIFMYPQVILLALATLRQDRGIIPYLLPLNGIGGSISFFHYLQQKIPGLAWAIGCQVNSPCSIDPLQELGWVTIPLLTWVAFVGMIVSLWLARSKPSLL